MQEVEEAVEFMAAVRVAFPEVARCVHTSQVAHAVLAHKARLVEQVAHSGAPPHPPWTLGAGTLPLAPFGACVRRHMRRCIRAGALGQL